MPQPVDQIQYWNETAGPKWVRYQETLDAQIGPIGRVAMDRAALRQGERVLDVGCGCGDTTIELAKRVGPNGSVLGVDVSAPMLELAGRRIHAAGASNARVERADAQTHSFPKGAFDVLFSRFGVMFFPDASAAFRNLRAALRGGGRLAFVCWQPIDRNPWILLPTMAAAKHVAIPPPPGVDEPGPFSFANSDRVRRILGEAGFTGVALEPLETSMTIGAGATIDQAVEFIMQLGPAAASLKDAGQEQRTQVAGAIRETFEPYATKDGVRLGAACWVVTAMA